MIKKWVIGLIIVMFAAFLTSGILLVSTGGIKKFKSESFKINEEAVFTDLSDVTEIYIDSTNPNINIINTDSEELKVNLIGELNGLFFEKDFKLETSKENHKINIETKNKFIGFLVFSSNVKLNIYLPKSYNQKLNIQSTNGDVIMNDRIFSELVIEVTNGRIKLNTIETSNGNLQTTNGDMKINSIKGKYTLSSTNGDIDISVIDLFDLQISSTNGDVTVHNVHNSLVSISTTNGDINHINNFIGTQNKRFVSGTIGNSDNQLTISTTNGDVEVK